MAEAKSNVVRGSGEKSLQERELDDDHRLPSWRARVADYLSLERNVTVASAAVFLLGLGEELWKKFLPKYLESLGAGPGVIGLFGTMEIGRASCRERV